MKVQDLFIGAWVQTENIFGDMEYARVVSIYENGNVLVRNKDGDTMGDMRHFKPIPLTMEILENNELIHISEYDDDIPCFGYYSIDGRNGGFRIDINPNSVRCCYVHQLQALLNLAGFEKEIVIK